MHNRAIYIRRARILVLLVFGPLVAGCVPTASGPVAGYGYPPSVYRWPPPAPDSYYSMPATPPQTSDAGITPASPPKAPEPTPPTNPAGLEGTRGWWRGGGIFWPRWQEPIP
jgi:hypothetical protein